MGKRKIEEPVEEEPVEPVSEKKKKKKKKEEEPVMEVEEEAPPTEKKKKKKKKEEAEEEAEEEAPTTEKKKKKEAEEAETNGAEDGEGPFKAFVRGLAYAVDEAKMTKDFAAAGEIEEVKLLKDDEGWSRGIAFVTFKTKKGLTKLIEEWNEQEYEGRTIGVREAESKGGGKGKGKGGGAKPEGCLGVFVSQIGPDVEEDDLWTFFEDCGTVARVHMLTDRDTGAPRGLAFVDFEETESTDKAVAKSGNDLKGKELFIKFNAPREDKGKGKDGKGKGKGKGGGEKPDGCLGVFVGSIGPDVEEDDLWEFFGDCGTVSKVKMLTDRDTGAPRGLAFVDFEETESTDKAVAKNGTWLKSKELFIKFNVPRDDSGKGKDGKGKGKDGKGKGKDGKGKGKGKGKAPIEFLGSAKKFDDDSD